MVFNGRGLVGRSVAVWWSEAMDYLGVSYTVHRIAFIERELAALKDRMRQFEASRHELPDTPPVRPPAE